MRKLLIKYKSLPIQVKSSLWFTVSNVMQKGIQFFTVPILTRIMPAADYGKYSLFLSWYQIVSIFATLNLWNYVMNNGMLKFEKDRNGYVSSLQGLGMTVTVTLCLIYLLFSDQWEKATSLSRSVMLVMFLELLLMPSYECWCAREKFEYRYRGVVVLSLVVAALVPAVSIPAVILSEDKGMTAIVCRSLISAAVFVIPAIMIMAKGKKFIDLTYWKFALRFNIPLIPHFLSLIVLQQSDRIMIGKMVGEDKAGIYSVAYSAATTIQIVNSAILASFVPFTYISIKNRRYAQIRENANYLLGFVAALNIVFICIAPEAIRILGPEEYYEAVYIIPPVAASGVFMFLFNLFANVEYYFEETKFVAAASFFSAAMNVVLNIICIPRFGYLAAGYTTLFCYLLYSLGHYIFMRLVCIKHLGEVEIYHIQKLVTITVVYLACSFGLMFIYQYMAIRYLLLIVITMLGIVKRREIIKKLNMIKNR